jgi:ferredoxin-NADP reductase
MMDAVKATLASLDVPKAQIKTEAFGTIKRNPAATDTGSMEIAGRAIFLASGVTAPVPIDATILDAADLAGI